MSLLDTACARVALSQSATPGAIEDAQRRIQRAETTLATLQREHAATGEHQEQLDNLNAEKAETEQLLATLETQRQEESVLILEIQQVRDQIDNNYLAEEKGEEAPCSPNN